MSKPFHIVKDILKKKIIIDRNKQRLFNLPDGVPITIGKEIFTTVKWSSFFDEALKRGHDVYKELVSMGAS